MDPMDIHPALSTHGSTKHLQKGRPVSELEIPEGISDSGNIEIRKYIDSKRLAYYDNAQVWYCPSCSIVCANEEVSQ